MKYTSSLLTAGLASAAIMFAPLAFADDDKNKMPEDTVQMSKLIENLQTNGYNVILKVEFDDGQYRANVIDTQGKPLRLEIAPSTGEILKPKQEETVLSILDAAKKVEDAGYHNIYKISTHKDKVEIKAFDTENKKVTLDVNAKTGEISKELF